MLSLDGTLLRFGDNADDSLRFGAPYNLFIFDAIVDRIWDIGQARFGARCMKTILDSPNTPKYQKVSTGQMDIDARNASLLASSSTRCR